MPARYVARRVEDFIKYRILHVDDTPHRIALGVAIGIFVTWTPTIGAQMILIAVVSTLLRANKLVGVPLAWISNPFTLVPIYGPNFYVGRRLLGKEFSWSAFAASMEKVVNFKGNWVEGIYDGWNALWPILPSLWLGSVIVGLILAVGSYFVIYYAIIGYRQRFPHAHKSKRPPQSVGIDD